jgi:hypothetical protein
MPIPLSFDSGTPAILLLQVTKPVSSKNAGKLSSMIDLDVNGLSAVSFLQQASKICSHKPLIPIFTILRAGSF